MSEIFTISDCNDEIGCVSRPLAPEDVRAGMYVAVLTETVRVWPWCVLPEDIAYGRVRPAEFVVAPRDGGAALRVLEVCLPYVLAESAHGKAATFDVRRVRLTRVSERYGRELFRLERERKARKRERAQDESSK